MAGRRGVRRGRDGTGLPAGPGRFQQGEGEPQHSGARPGGVPDGEGHGEVHEEQVAVGQPRYGYTAGVNGAHRTAAVALTKFSAKLVATRWHPLIQTFSDTKFVRVCVLEFPCCVIQGFACFQYQIPAQSAMELEAQGYPLLGVFVEATVLKVTTADVRRRACRSLLASAPPRGVASSSSRQRGGICH